MAIYTYECKKCGTFEELVPMSKRDEFTCCSETKRLIDKPGGVSTTYGPMQTR